MIQGHRSIGNDRIQDLRKLGTHLGSPDDQDSSLLGSYEALFSRRHPSRISLMLHEAYVAMEVLPEAFGNMTWERVGDMVPQIVHQIHALTNMPMESYDTHRKSLKTFNSSQRC